MTSPVISAAPPDQGGLSARDPRLAAWRTLLQAHAMLLRRLDDRHEVFVDAPEMRARRRPEALQTDRGEDGP